MDAINPSSKHEKSLSITKELGNGLTKNIRVRKISNGYIISKNIYGRKDEDEEYTDITQEYYSKNNPFEKEEEEEEDEEVKMSKLLNSLNNI